MQKYSLLNTEDGLVCSFPAHWFQAGWSSVNGSTCFDHHSCQQGDETGSQEKTQIEKWAGNLELWTPLCSSVSCSLSHMLILFSEWHTSGRGKLGTANPCKFSPPKSILSNSQKFPPAKYKCYTIPIFHKYNQFTMQSYSMVRKWFEYLLS